MSDEVLRASVSKIINLQKEKESINDDEKAEWDKLKGLDYNIPLLRKAVKIKKDGSLDEHEEEMKTFNIYLDKIKD